MAIAVNCGACLCCLVVKVLDYISDLCTTVVCRCVIYRELQSFNFLAIICKYIHSRTAVIICFSFGHCGWREGACICLPQ